MIYSTVPVFPTFIVAFPFFVILPLLSRSCRSVPLGEMRERWRYGNLERYGEVAKIRKQYCIQQNDSYFITAQTEHCFALGVIR